MSITIMAITIMTMTITAATTIMMRMKSTGSTITIVTITTKTGTGMTRMGNTTIIAVIMIMTRNTITPGTGITNMSTIIMTANAAVIITGMRGTITIITPTKCSRAGAWRRRRTTAWMRSRIS